MLDRKLTPTDDQQSFYIYVPLVPFRLAGGQPWAVRPGELSGKVQRQMETVMPKLPRWRRPTRCARPRVSNPSATSPAAACTMPT